MNSQRLSGDYAVLVTEHNGEYTLRIKELLLFVQGRDLDGAYRQIVEQKRRLIHWATMLESLDELPEPTWPALASGIRFSSFAGNRPSRLVRRDASREPGTEGPS